MTLSTEDLGDFSDVRADDVARIIDEDAFGSFVILSQCDEGFIQAANNWSADGAGEAFVARHDSDPWILEYRDAASGTQFQATRNVTLIELRTAFLDYLRGGFEWRTHFQWTEIDV